MTAISNTLTKPTRLPKTELLLLLVAIFWGTSYGLTKHALIFSSVLVFLVIRFSLTFLSLLPFAVRDFQRGLNKDWHTAIPTGFILSAIFFCEVYGVFQTSASNAAFLISLSVILTAFAEFFINKQKISWQLLVLALWSVVGVYLLTQNQQTQWSLNTGDYFILAAALLRALMVTATKRLTEGKQISTTTLTCIQSFIVASCALVIAMITLPMAEIALPQQLDFWAILAYLVLFCTLFAFYVQNHAVRNISPTKASLLMGSEPLFGALFAMLWLNEQLSLLQMLGGALILISVLLTSIRQR